MILNWRQPIALSQKKGASVEFFRIWALVAFFFFFYLMKKRTVGWWHNARRRSVTEFKPLAARLQLRVSSEVREWQLLISTVLMPRLNCRRFAAEDKKKTQNNRLKSKHPNAPLVPVLRKKAGGGLPVPGGGRGSPALHAPCSDVPFCFGRRRGS